MSLTQHFTDPCGVDHADAHWRAVQVNISAAGQSIGLTFYAYRDLAAFQQGRQPLPGGRKSYTVTGAEFLAIAMAAPDGATLYDALANAADTYALGKLDTPNGTLDGAGQPVLASFFASATRA